MNKEQNNNGEVWRRQTWEQFVIKRDMGLFNGIRSLSIKFHWKFWKPIDAIGGRVYFGRYAEYDERDFYPNRR